MKKRSLVIYIPVIHQGYIRLLSKYSAETENVYIISDNLLKEFETHEPNIAVLGTSLVEKLLTEFGYTNIKILSSGSVKDLEGVPLILVDDDLSRRLSQKYFVSNDVVWEKVFLRWDRKKVISENNVDALTSEDGKDVEFMKEAYLEAEKSSDWWRQVGAVLVKDGVKIMSAYNEGVPDDHAPYQVGAIRDYLEVGEHPHLSSTIHAEQVIIARAASEGIPLKNTSLYVTHFPCAVCAKLISKSGIKACYFSEGSSNADGVSVLKSAKVKINRVPIEHK